MTDPQEKPPTKPPCSHCGSLSHDGQEFTCPYRQHRVHERIFQLRSSNSNPSLADARWLFEEMERWVDRWVATRQSAIDAQHKVAESISIRLVTDSDGCAGCAHFFARSSTCMAPKLKSPQQLDAGVYVPPWCPGPKPKSDAQP
jgi:hypothetical protein